MDENIKPCPFCGGEAKLTNREMQGLNAFVTCASCGATSGDGSPERVVRKWNTRAAPKVNLLVWEDYGDSSFIDEHWNYRIRKDGERWALFPAELLGQVIGHFNTLEEAKAAAQALHDKWVRSMLLGAGQ